MKWNCQVSKLKKIRFGVMDALDHKNSPKTKKLKKILKNLLNLLDKDEPNI